MATVPLALASFFIGLLIAVVTALARLSSSKILRGVFYAYVWIFRGTPLLLQLFITFFGLSQLGLALNVWTASIIALALNTGAYASESVRAAILSIPKGQWEAAQSIGMNQGTIYRRIIAPQAARTCIPPLFNTFISLVKDTSLASSITMLEMFMQAQRIAAYYYEPLWLYIEAGLFYLVVCTLLTALQGRLEKTTSKHI
jgi:cystine transport system permease protein